jgi:TfoX/Sxy family transcriptional regulator of competence genes
MKWNELASSPLSDMLRDELIMAWIADAEHCVKEHRASAAKFASAGNHAAAMSEINAANEYRRRAAMWRAELAKEQGVQGDE